MDWYLICCFVILKTAVSSCYYIILSFVTSSKARKLSTIRTNTHTHTRQRLLFFLQCNTRRKKNPWMLTCATCIWLLLTLRWVQFSDSPPPNQTKLPWISQLWVNKRRQALAKSDWWLGSVCLLLLFIHVFILPVVIPSDPASLHPFLSLFPQANEETMSCYIRCDMHPPYPQYECLCVFPIEKNTNYIKINIICCLIRIWK